MTEKSLKLSEILLNKLRAEGREPHPNSLVRRALLEVGVPRNPEFARIIALPRRAASDRLVEAEVYAQRFVRGGVKCSGCRICRGGVRWRGLQPLALLEASEQNGLFANLAVGAGKTLIALLLPVAMDARRAVIVTKPQLKRQVLEIDGPLYARHYAVDWSRISVVSYSELSSAGSADALDRISPDLIVADEAHLLRRISAARTKRFRRFLKHNPGTRACYLSGTLVGPNLLDYAFFLESALGARSPVPTWPALGDWAAALGDPIEGSKPMPPGALLELCSEDELAAPNERAAARAGFARRRRETPGVLVTENKGSCDTSLLLRALRVGCQKSRKALAHLDRLWCWDGEEIPEAMRKAAVAKQLGLGFWYRWDWPGGVKDKEWLAARRDWNREVRETLRARSGPGFDSPMLLANAAERGDWRSSCWAAWKAVKQRPEPPTVPVWYSQHAVVAALEWAVGGGIVWTWHTAFGRRLAEVGGLPYFGEGDDARLDAAIVAEVPTMVVSAFVGREGKNLQAAWSRMLITSPPSSAGEWEQVLGRLHREGQMEDVEVDVLFGCDDAERSFAEALRQAESSGEFGQEMKLWYADKIGF